MHRAQIINSLIKKYGYNSYLEIGVSNADCHKLIVCDMKVGVDPEPLSPATYEMTSDEFFEKHREVWDIIFIDGLHHAQQVHKDILNALKVLNKGGTIVCHDMNPMGFQEQFVPRQQKRWNGDCWRAWVQLRMDKDDLEMYVVDTDEGCGIIKKGKQEKLVIDFDGDLTYDMFDVNREEWLNLKSVAYFLHQLQ